MPKLPQEIQKIKSRRALEVGCRYRQGGPRVGLLYPSPYRAAMSSLGYQWMLSILQDAGFSAERIILPDNIKAWTQSRSPLLSYESLTPLSHFPIIAVSLAYELELAGLIQALEASGIPALRAHRGPNDPLILLGGPLTFSNPIPAAPFVDAILLGEAEETIVPAITASFECHRSEWLKTIAALPGGYVPELHGDHLPNIAKSSDVLLPARSHIISPDAELRNMFLIEGERGCHRSCSFCVMRRSTNGGMRLVTPETILSYVPEHAQKVGLVGAAISDHPKLVNLLEQIVASGREVGVSSLRADRIARKPDIARLLRAGGYQTLTVASDAASQRLRRTISKGTLEKHLVACAEQAALHKYRTLKVYMMVGLPDEREEDIEELIRFTVELSQIHNVALGIAPFVAKKNTPMDGLPFAGIKMVNRHLKLLEKGLKQTKGRASIRPTSAKWAWVEYVLAQGGVHAGRAVYEAVKAGGGFADYKRAFSSLDETQQRPWAKVQPMMIHQ
ncbi:MAG: B12-binding domain-containing radical SAM protein [Myxococcota bacterium]|nr:B12-binding domain-containing radical SAM protein [Myxococcota bacterium]